MVNYTTEYELCNGIETLKFNSEKEACEFLGVRKSTVKQQANNRRTNHFIEMDGIVHTISEWSDITGVRYSLIYSRVQRGWSLKDAITKPAKRKKKNIEEV